MVIKLWNPSLAFRALKNEGRTGLGEKDFLKGYPLPLFLHERDVGEVLAPKTKSNDGLQGYLSLRIS